MTTRTALAVGFGAGAAVLMAIGVVLDPDKGAATVGLFGNIGAEILGIALTVAIIDWLMERRRINEEVRRLAWRMLFDLDHAFWVWQGGRREFHLDELVALLGMAEKSDPLPPFTEELFINLGIRASDTLRLQPRLMAHDRRLKAAMRSLAGLAQIREARHIVDATYIIEGLRTAVSNLAEITEQTPHAGEFAAAKSFRDPTEDAQHQRYRGTVTDMMVRAGHAGLGDDIASRMGASQQGPSTATPADPARQG